MEPAAADSSGSTGANPVVTGARAPGDEWDDKKGDFMGFYGGFMGFYGGLMGFYPLANVYIAMENHNF